MKPTVIVCAIEFSAAGSSAVARALALARWHEAELHVVHVGPHRRSGNSAFSTTASDDALSARLRAFVESVNGERIHVCTVVLHGDPVKTLLGYAHMISADLVVVGQNGRRGSYYWSTGAFAEEVAQGVQCPTIMVPSTATHDADADGSFSNIICGVDFSPTSDLAVHRALSLAQQSRGRLTLLHVLEGFPYESVYSGSRAFRLIEEYRARVERVRRELRARVPSEALNWCEVETEAVSGVPGEAIVAMALARRADLIVIGMAPRTMLQRIVMRSTVAAVLRHARCAVLTVPARPRASDVTSESMCVREDDNEPGTTLISSATLRGVRDMSTHSAEGG